MTYLALETRSNRLAHRLRDMGVRADAPVAVLMGRSPQAVTAMLGILKSGAAYVPVDAECPTDRLQFMLTDASVQIVIAEDRLKARLPLGPWAVLSLDEDSATDPPAIDIDQNSLAYIMYTSGSTGQPKGVMVTHRNLTNLVDWHRDEFQVVAEDRASQVASLGFDAAGWEIWPYLAAGASVHFAPESARREPEALRDWLVEERVTIAFVPTALAEHMLSLPWPNSASLRYLLTGADMLRRYPPRGLPFTLINNYGPTEGTVVSTSGAIAADSPNEQAPSIGRPIRNVYAYVLDQELHPAEPGCPGELYIGGAGVARGYLNRPELTAAKFVDDPFNSGRMYATGDLARLLPDGQIGFLGRRDNQIKIRGYRMEPEEIGVVLTRHSAVHSAVVRAWADSSGEKRLLAYVVGRNAATVDDAVLKAFLRTHLPEYMVPAMYVWLDSLPMTLNGKVDYAALPEPQIARTITDEGALIEIRVASLLSNLLGLNEVGREDNFFMLGGHSLLGAQLIARIREVFGVSLTLRNLFEAPTVGSLAAAIEAKSAGQLAEAAAR